MRNAGTAASSPDAVGAGETLSSRGSAAARFRPGSGDRVREAPRTTDLSALAWGGKGITGEGIASLAASVAVRRGDV